MLQDYFTRLLTLLTLVHDISYVMQYSKSHHAVLPRGEWITYMRVVSFKVPYLYLLKGKFC